MSFGVLIIVAACTLAAGFFIGQRRSVALGGELSGREKRIRELEKDAHLQEMRKIEELNKAKVEHFELIKAEREKAYLEGCEKTKAEVVLQQRSISVSMRPYVNTLTDKGIFSETYKVEAGYIYQLMVNGVPALSPHIVIERREEWSEMNEERLQALSNAALKLTEAAITTYLGNVGAGLVFKKDVLVKENTKQ